MNFKVLAGGVPGKATLISPSGNITTANPVSEWAAVPTAAYYQLWVNDSTASPKIRTWYTAADAGCASGTGTCFVTPTTALSPGPCQWWIQTWNDNGYGPWSDALQFTVVIGGTPGKVTLVFPRGTITTTTPTYVWNADSTATWYYLWVNDNAGIPRIQAWYTSGQVGCTSGIGLCSVTPSIGFTSSAGRWWIQTWNPNGYGPWSDPLDFALIESSILRK